MASDITRWPWVLDSATFAGEFTGGIVTTQKIAPGTVQWTSKSASAGDQVILQHADGKPFWTSCAATGADFSDDAKFPESVRLEGLKIIALPSGIVEFYFR